MSEHLHEYSIVVLTQPIDGGGGDDLSFSELFDQIKEARRADASYLTQGEWQAELKHADWEQVVRLSADGLSQQSKDLRLVAWLCEGLGHQHRFEGVAFGLSVCDAILKGHWPRLYPALDEGLEARAERLAWLSTTLTDIVASVPLTQDPPYGLALYDQSLQVDNRGRQSPEAMDACLAEGKINGEMFQRAAALTAVDYLHTRHTEVQKCLSVCRSLQTSIDVLFELDAPRLTRLDETLVRVNQLTERLLAERGGDVVRTPAPAVAPQPTKPVAPRIPAQHEPVVTPSTVEAIRTEPQSRAEALAQLRGVVQYFKQTEPHSPVPLLIERAIKWGDMPLESWLSDVIKDSSVVDGIRNVLGTDV
ncbi:type VI secretion system protein TssA [Pseudomonas orientalis]|uniref:Type VI secretion system protein ImpA n=1 Tax=Pseudomonas orientalis TaxID=76758 RepID=A0A1H2DVR2_9PSED|nr:type VI secretion system protein TssA [Pseudomonas orientalis]KRP62110.1 ImpA-like protein [Pseudomonas orientalis]SDT86936.1 type VI secretion system protein ImpA [Pseudomonas orientalis]